MKNKNYLLSLVLIILVSIATTYTLLYLVINQNKQARTQSVAITTSKSTITAEGTIHSTNEATLHFQTGGKLTYLPVKEGDKVMQGQTIALLDTYALQKQLAQALNNYRSTRDTFDQTKDNSNNAVLQGSQKFVLETQNKSGISGDQENTAINDIVKRVIDQNQANLDNAVINVELTNYAMQLATLTAPFNGIITHEDVTTANQNITQTTNFVIEDPQQLVFKANINARDIDFITEGTKATIRITGLSKQTFSGTITKIYPQKITVKGENVYQVDITSKDMLPIAKLGQTGSVTITSNNPETMMIPTWLVSGHRFVWIEQQGKPILKKITLGKIHGDQIEIVNGLKTDDKIIINPKSVAAQFYRAL
jgi:membrane fusion protein, multidrug efflux system